jgi:isoleucyl-tRNA synthetase
LKELIVIHSSPDFHADLKSVESYIYEELNVRKITVTANEEQYGVKYRALADHKVIGQKYRKDAGKIRNALPNIPSDKIKAFRKTGVLLVEGIELGEEELSVTSYFDSAAGLGNYAANSDREVLILLDMTKDEELMQEGLARELVNRVQRLRKKAGLNPSDEVDIHYAMIEDVEMQLAKMLIGQSEYLEKTFKRPLIDVDAGKQQSPQTSLIVEEDQEIYGSKFKLALMRI